MGRELLLESRLAAPFTWLSEPKFYYTGNSGEPSAAIIAPRLQTNPDDLTLELSSRSMAGLDKELR
jgi:hypothetical protein